MTFVFHPTCISKKKLKNCRGGQPHPRLEGVTILCVQSEDFSKTIFVGKIHRNPSNIHKIMTVCQLALLGLKGLRLFVPLGTTRIVSEGTLLAQ